MSLIQLSPSNGDSLLIKSGYDKILSSSTNYTVFAPTNDALNGLSTSIVNDTAQLKAVS